MTSILRAHRPGSRRAWLATVVALAATAVPTPPAEAEATPLTCTFESTIAITPAIGAQDVWYDWSTAGDPATISCHGWLQGTPIAGTGRFREVGRGFGSRVSGRGAVDVAGWLPAGDGSVVPVAGHLWLERTGLAGSMTGYLNGQLIGGAYTVEPRDPLAASTTGSTVTVRGASELADRALAPPTPTDVMATATASGIRLSWASGEREPGPEVTDYHLYLDGAWVDEVSADARTYVFEDLAPGPHTVAVAAFSSAGIESEVVAAADGGTGPPASEAHT